MKNPILRSLFPIIESLDGYSRDDFNHDLTAGLVLAVLTVPQGMAYAYLAGLPPQAGLYASLLPAVIYACTGSSREMIVGPVAVAALLVASTVGEFSGAGRGSWSEITAVLTVETSLALLFLFAIRGDGIVNLLSGPVITGFINAAAVLIMVNQVDDLLGIQVASSSLIDQIPELVAGAAQLNLPTVGIAAGALAILITFRMHLFDRLLPNAPIHRLGPIVAVIVTSLAVVYLDLEAEGVTTVGYVPAGLPALVLPVTDWRLWIDIAPSAAIIALIAFVESYSIGANLAARRRRRIRPSQELFALGASNLASAMTGGYPVAGSFSRSSVNFSAGGRTQLSALICAACVLATVMFLTAWFEPMPNAVLAVIILMSVVGLIEIAPMISQWQYSRRDALVNAVTFFGVLIFGIEAGLIGGVFLGLSLIVLRTSRPHMAEIGRVDNSSHFRSTHNYPNARTTPGILAIRVDENLQFTNVRAVERFIIRTLGHRDDDIHHLVLACNAVNFIDATGLEMLERLSDELAPINIQVHLADVKFPVMERLVRADLPARLSGQVFFATDDALTVLSAQPGSSP